METSKNARRDVTTYHPLKLYNFVRCAGALFLMRQYLLNNLSREDLETEAFSHCKFGQNETFFFSQSQLSWPFGWVLNWPMVMVLWVKGFSCCIRPNPSRHSKSNSFHGFQTETVHFIAHQKTALFKPSKIKCIVCKRSCFWLRQERYFETKVNYTCCA